MGFDFNKAMEFINNARQSDGVMELNAEKELLGRIHNPQDNLKVILITGTNGKGSTLAMISSILKEAGYKVGSYISPTLATYLEHIQINGKHISEHDFAHVMSKIYKAAEDMQIEGHTVPTAFELVTVAAYEYFYEQRCDFAVMEVGMGGENDATNVCRRPLCCVFTPIGMDHTDRLGSTLEEIARAKAGIITSGTYVVTANQEYEAMTEIRRRCRKMKCFFTVSDYRLKVRNVTFGDIISGEKTAYQHADYGNIILPLNGTFQILNSCTAIDCIEALCNLGYNIQDKNIVDGIAKTKWFGRLTRIGTRPPFFIDGAHNAPAAEALAESIGEYFSPERLDGRKLVYIMGIFADKDVTSIIHQTVPMADYVFTIATPDNDRALDSGELAKKINNYKPCAEACPSIPEAVEKACSYNDGNVIVLAFGSLSHLNNIKEAYTEWTKTK